MLRPEHVELLRCPLDPGQTRLELCDGEAALLCQRCRLKFPIREGIPALLVEEAELPPGVAAVGELPCQRKSPGEPGA